MFESYTADGRLQLSANEHCLTLSREVVVTDFHLTFGTCYMASVMLEPYEILVGVRKSTSYIAVKIYQNASGSRPCTVTSNTGEPVTICIMRRMPAQVDETNGVGLVLYDEGGTPCYYSGQNSVAIVGTYESNDLNSISTGFSGSEYILVDTVTNGYWNMISNGGGMYMDLIQWWMSASRYDSSSGTIERAFLNYGRTYEDPPYDMSTKDKPVYKTEYLLLRVI